MVAAQLGHKRGLNDAKLGDNKLHTLQSDQVDHLLVPVRLCEAKHTGVSGAYLLSTATAACLLAVIWKTATSSSA